MIAFFRRIATDVGDYLGYPYPEDFDRRVTEHAWRMRTGESLFRV